jgi:hypothetical protein
MESNSEEFNYSEDNTETLKHRIQLTINTLH